MATAKRKPFVIYQMFWMGTRWKRWNSYDSLADAELALARLNASPSARYYSYMIEKSN